MPSPKPSPKISSNLGLLLSLGWGIAAWITLGVLAGHWADGHFGWQPWGTLTGALAGIAGGGWTMYRVVRRLDSQTDPQTDSQMRSRTDRRSDKTTAGS